MPTRYDTDHITEAQFEPGSCGRVLKNSLGIYRKREMDALKSTKARADFDTSTVFL